MPVQSIPIGPLTPMKMGVIYSLPPVKCLLFITNESVMLESSQDINFATIVYPTLIGGYAEVDGGFIRSTISNISVSLKRE
jgi:hypothetical protein